MSSENVRARSVGGRDGVAGTGMPGGVTRPRGGRRTGMAGPLRGGWCRAGAAGLTAGFYIQ